MRGVQRLSRPCPGDVGFHRPVHAQPGPEVSALAQAHVQVELAVDLAEAVDRHHVWPLSRAATRHSRRNRSWYSLSAARCAAGA